MNPEAAAAPYPNPPPFYKLYKNPGTAPRPPPPVEGKFLVFGFEFDTAEPLVPSLPVQPLFQQTNGNVDFKAELSRLSCESVFLYLELLRALVENPTQYARALTALYQVLHNMQHLVNMMRPFQARATLEYALKLKVQEQKDALTKLRSGIEAADNMLLSLTQKIVDAVGDAAESAAPANQPVQLPEGSLKGGGVSGQQQSLQM